MSSSRKPITGLSFDLGKETTAITLWSGMEVSTAHPVRLLSRSFSQYRNLGQVMYEWGMWVSQAFSDPGLSHLKPSFVAYEETFPRSKYAAEIRYAMTGWLVAAAWEREIPVYAIVTSMMKKHVTGVGNADKDRTIAAVKKLYPGIDGLRSNPMADGITHDEADSIAVGETLLAMLRGETVIPVKRKGKSKLKANKSSKNNREKAA